MILCFSASISHGQEIDENHDKSEAKSPVFIELFSSQACTFCPAADRLMGELIKKDQVIGLTCHVDYFDVKKGSLAQPFCTTRQMNYVRLLSKGPHYTPQMVINGHHDVIGYEAQSVSDAIQTAQREKLHTVTIRKTGDEIFEISLKNDQIRETPARLWMAVFDKPRTLTVKEGGNRGKTITYHNIVSDIVDLGSWDGQDLSRALTPTINENHGGFAVVAQDIKTGQILAAGQTMFE